jgi:hypothetical protein
MSARFEGIYMSALQAFFLGIMVVWTPALLFLAWVLRYAAFGDSLEAARWLGHTGGDIVH